MLIAKDNIDRVCAEHEVYEELLDLDHGYLLDLGCGGADQTRKIASAGTGRRMVGLEVDEIQHAQNLKIDDLPNVTFELGGAQSIPAEDEVFDAVFMFKSLHHVPVDLHDQALKEISRVLKPGGQAYISEPIFAGEFNDILKLFHDEKAVRKAAFQALEKAVNSGLFSHQGQHFFKTPLHFDDFSAFEQQTIKATHTDHNLSPALYDQVKSAFEAHLTHSGVDFHHPIRVDLLAKH